MERVNRAIRNQAARTFRQAQVLEVDSDGEHVRVRPVECWEGASYWARLALGQQPSPCVGDRVLVAGDAPEELYVIGCLTSARPQRAAREPVPPAVTRLTTASGVYAERVESSAGQESIRVLSDRDELLFEHDAATGATRLAIPSGRLELLNEGDIVLRAGGTLRLDGNAIELQGQRSVGITIARSVVAASTWLWLLPERLQLGGERIEISARRGELQFEQATVRGDSLTAEADVCQLKARKVEVLAETLIERVGSVYRTVRDLLQVQAGRLRTYVSGLSHFRSKRAYFSSEEDFHVHGDKIHLG